MEQISETPNDEFSNITLRLLGPADIDDFMVWATDEKVPVYCSWESFISREAAMNYIVETIVPHPWFRAICLNDRAIGYVLVTRHSGGDACRAEIGYVLGSNYWGKGIATKAVKLVAGTIFKESPELERLEAFVDVDNVASQKVMEKAGFLKEGVLRKHYIMKGKTRDFALYSLLSTDPQVI